MAKHQTSGVPLVTLRSHRMVFFSKPSHIAIYRGGVCVISPYRTKGTATLASFPSARPCERVSPLQARSGRAQNGRASGAARGLCEPCPLCSAVQHTSVPLTKQLGAQFSQPPQPLHSAAPRVIAETPLIRDSALTAGHGCRGSSPSPQLSARKLVARDTGT